MVVISSKSCTKEKRKEKKRRKKKYIYIYTCILVREIKKSKDYLEKGEKQKREVKGWKNKMRDEPTCTSLGAEANDKMDLQGRGGGLKGEEGGGKGRREEGNSSDV